jgi:protease IV
MKYTLHALLLLFVCGACEQERGRTGAPATGTTASAARELVEISLPGPLLAGQSPFAAGGDAIGAVEKRVRELITDEKAAGIFLRVGPLPGAWVKSAELGTALDRFRAAHKPVHCHFDVADGVSYRLIASHCDRVTMTPAGHLNVVGSAAQVFFVRSLLASIGVQAEILHVGRFKGTGDSLTLDEMPETMRESLGAIVDEFDNALLRAVAEQTGLDPAGAAALVDRGPFDGSAALRAKLIDGLEFDDEARAHAKTAANATRVRPPRGEAAPQSLMELIERIGRAAEQSTVRGPHVAVVRLEGPIVDGERQLPNQIRSEPTVAHLRALADDPDVKVVVLQIDSPGGSVIASDRIWHAVRRVVAHKPVVASIGAMGASGGYYIASAATEIYALDESLVGSIGVVAGKADASGLLSRLGANPVTIARRAHAGSQTLTRAWTPDERATLQASMEGHYERFIDRIATGRGIDEARIRPYAEGRLWTGRAAREHGLVEHQGGFQVALARARVLGHLPEDAKTDTWPREEGFLEKLIALFVGDPSAEAAVGRWLASAGIDLALLQSFVSTLESTPVMVAVPYILELR